MKYLPNYNDINLEINNGRKTGKLQKKIEEIKHTLNG